MTNCCMNCDYCDNRRKNAIGMPRCKQHNMFVASDDCCDFHCNKGVIEKELWTKMKGAVDEDNPTQNQRGNSELNSELKPCPFCGGEAEIKKTQHILADTYSVVCKDKVCRGRAVKPLRDKEAAIVTWNRRAADVSPMKEVERIMKEHIDFRKEEGDVRAEIALEQALSEIVEQRKKYTEKSK